MNRAFAVIAEIISGQDNKYFLIEELVVKFGYNCAVFLGFLLNRFFYYTRTDQLFSHNVHGDGWFYMKIDDVEGILHLSRKEQDCCIRKFLENDCLEVKTMGLPPKRYFRLNIEKIAEIMTSQDVVSNLRHMYKLSTEGPKGDFSEKSKNSTSTTECEPMCPEGAIPYVPKGQFHPYIDNKNIYKNNNTPPYPQMGEPCVREEPAPKPEKKQNSSKQKSSAPPKAEFGSHVKLYLEEYTALIEKHGRPLVDQIIEEMNDYCSASRTKGYSCYAAAIRQWIRRRREREELERARERPLSATEESRKVRKRLFNEWMERNGNPDEAPNVICFD